MQRTRGLAFGLRGSEVLQRLPFILTFMRSEEYMVTVEVNSLMDPHKAVLVKMWNKLECAVCVKPCALRAFDGIFV